MQCQWFLVSSTPAAPCALPRPLGSPLGAGVGPRALAFSPANGYTALVPEEDPPSPLNNKSLNVLSTVYGLWAGARLEEVILWQGP